MWTELFKQLSVQLLYSTAYYPQTDRANKWINQTIEIMLWFYLNTLDKIN